MDGREKQQEMADQLKQDVKAKAHLRAEARVGSSYGSTRKSLQSSTLPTTNPAIDLASTTLPATTASTTSCTLGKIDLVNLHFKQSDTVLMTFYIEHLMPLMFPFYRPSIMNGGRAWVLEMMLKSPVVRQSTLCQSSYFFNIARGAECRTELCNTILTQYGDASRVLRHALQVLLDSDVASHLHGAVRVLVSIMQLQRFEIAMASFESCQTHFDGAVALFRQIMETSGDHPELGFKFEEIIMGRLQQPLENDSKLIPHMPSAEQAAFRFATSSLILDDIIASTITKQQPLLYDYHRHLLSFDCYDSAAIDFVEVIGVQNKVVRQIGEIAALDSWKTFAKTTNTLDIMDLAARGSVIKAKLEAEISRIVNTMDVGATDDSLLSHTYRPHNDTPSTSAASIDMVTRIWAHAALLYLHIVVSGWQPTNVEVQHHVTCIQDILLHHDVTLLRTIVWPLVVAGCLAAHEQESDFRAMVQKAQPSKVYGTVHKALAIMENAWQHRSDWTVDWDLAACFRNQDELVLLV